MAQPHISSVLSAILGVLITIPYIVVTGILAMQVDAGRLGLSADLLNRPTGVQEPGSAWLAVIGLAVVSLLTVILITQGREAWGGRARAAMGFGFAVVMLAVVVYGVFVTGPDFMFGLQRLEMLDGPHSWIDRAGNSTSVHLALAIVMTWSISQLKKVKPVAADSLNSGPFADPSASVDPSTGYQVN